LKRLANIKRIEAHMNSIFPTDGAEVSQIYLLNYASCLLNLIAKLTIIYNCLIHHLRAKRKEKARRKGLQIMTICLQRRKR
jgi:hypothetical protein